MRRLSPAVQIPSLTSEVSVELRLLCLGDWLRLDLLGQVLTAASFVQEIAEVISPLTLGAKSFALTAASFVQEALT